MTTVEILRKARALIVERGWWSCGGPLGGHGDVGAHRCVSNALYEADDYASAAAVRDAHRAFAAAAGLGERVGKDYGKAAIFRWNDHPSREKAEVVAAFDRAILHEEAKAAALAPVVATPDRVGVA